MAFLIHRGMLSGMDLIILLIREAGGRSLVTTVIEPLFGNWPHDWERLH